MSRLNRQQKSSAQVDRRGFLGLAAGAASYLGLSQAARSDDRVPVTDPRSTSGDVAFEPKWDERLTITVGTKDADLVGNSDRVLQAAVDYVARLGGGTVKVLPGQYRLRNAVHLRSQVRLLGSGADSILLKEPSTSTKLAVDSDWYDQEITLVDASSFRVGDGVCLVTKDPHNGGEDVLKRTLIARSGNRFKLDRPLRENFWLVGESKCSSLFPILNCEEVAHVTIESITLDGNRANNENLNGNYAGGIFAQDCRNLTFREVESRNYNGDGFSWQICHDVIVEKCNSHDHTGLGLHPGSGSQRPMMRNNRIANADMGIFFCWGVKFGLAEANQVTGCRHGISIGHRDNNNLICNNEVRDSREAGVIFRPERGKDFAPHRNRLEDNRIVNVTADDGIGVDVQGETESISIARNEITQTDKPMSRIGLRIGAQTRDIRVADNRIEGFATAMVGQS